MSRDGFLSHQAAMKEVYTSGRLRHGDPQVGASDVPISLNLVCETPSSSWCGLSLDCCICIFFYKYND